jgi:hypothetical protein
LEGWEPYPQPGTPEARQLARYASYSSWNKADPQYLAAFAQYFYHDELHQDDPNDEEDYYDDEEGEEE